MRTCILWVACLMQEKKGGSEGAQGKYGKHTGPEPPAGQPGATAAPKQGPTDLAKSK